MKNNSEVGEVAKLMEKQQDLKQEKNEYIVDQQEKRNKRAEDLNRQMQEDTQEWK